MGWARRRQGVWRRWWWLPRRVQRGLPWRIRLPRRVRLRLPGRVRFRISRLRVLRRIWLVGARCGIWPWARGNRGRPLLLPTTPSLLPAAGLLRAPAGLCAATGLHAPHRPTARRQRAPANRAMRVLTSARWIVRSRRVQAAIAPAIAVSGSLAGRADERWLRQRLPLVDFATHPANAADYFVKSIASMVAADGFEPPTKGLCFPKRRLRLGSQVFA